MAILYLTRKYHFNAAHRLFHPDWSPEENFAVFDKCSYEDGHGHNYELEVTLRGHPDPETGQVFPPARLDRFVEELVLEPFDHRHLNRELRLVDGVAPTSEVFLVEIWDRLAAGLPGAAGLFRLKLWETARNVFDYQGPEVSELGDSSVSKCDTISKIW